MSNGRICVFAAAGATELFALNFFLSGKTTLTDVMVIGIMVLLLIVAPLTLATPRKKCPMCQSCLSMREECSGKVWCDDCRQEARQRLGLDEHT